MKIRNISAWLMIGLVLAALLALSTSTALASPLLEEGDLSGIFGEVVQVDEDTIVVNVRGETVTIRLSPDTRFAGPGNGDGVPDIQLGSRVAVMVVKQDDTRVAQMVMMIPQKVRMVHLMGVVGQVADDGVTIITDDGQHLIIKLPPNSPISEPGTVVTVVGRKDPVSGIIQARSVYQLNRTIERLSNHLDEIEDEEPDVQRQVSHRTRIRHLLERSGQRQVEILTKVIDKLPDEASQALERAVHDLEEANRAVLRAFSQAVEKANRAAEPPKVDQRDALSPDNLKPTRIDIARVLRISVDELQDLFSQGITLAQITQRVGITEEALFRGVVALVSERLKRLVEHDRLDARQAEQMLQRIREEAQVRIRQALDTNDTDDSDGKGFLSPEMPVSLGDLANILGLEPRDLSAQLRQGNSLFQIAEKHGLTSEQIKEAIMRLVKERANSLMARGHLTAEETERLTKQFREEILTRILETPSRDRQRAPSTDIDFQRRSVTELPGTREDIARILGMSVKELARFLEEGATLQQLARRRGVSVDWLVEKTVELERQRPEHQAEEKHIGIEEANRRSEEKKRRLHEELNRTPGPRVLSVRPATDIAKNVPFNLATVAKVLGISQEKLRQLLSEGNSLEQIAKRLNVNLDRLDTELQNPIESRIRSLLKAGRITEEQAKQMRSRTNQDVTQELRNYRLPEHRDIPSTQPEPNNTLTLESNSSRILALTTIQDVFRALGVQEKATELRRRGLNIAQVARELGFSPERMQSHLLEIAKEHVATAVKSGSLTSEEARKHVAHFQNLVSQRVVDIFAGISDRTRDQSIVTDEPNDSTTETHSTIAEDGSSESNPSRILALATIQDVFRALGVQEKATELRRRGLNIAQVARELGFSPERMQSHLLEIAKEHVATAVKSGSLTSEEARKHVAHFQNLVSQRVVDIFAGASDRTRGQSIVTDEPNDSTTETHSTIAEDGSSESNPSRILALATIQDVFRALGVQEKATELRRRGLSITQVARELGFSPERMQSHLLEIAKEHVATAVKSGSLTSEEARKQLTHFQNLVSQRVADIFAGASDRTREQSIVTNEPHDSTTIEGDASSTTKEEPTRTTDEPTTSSTEGSSSTIEGDTSSTTKEEPTGTTDESSTSSTEGSSSTIEGDTSSTTKEEPTRTTDEPTTSSTEGSSSTTEGDTSSTTKEEPTGTTDEPSTSSTTKEEPTGTTDESSTSSTEGSSSTTEGDTSSTTKEEPTRTTDEPTTSSTEGSSSTTEGDTSSTTKEEPTGTTDEPSTSSTTKEEPTGTTDEPSTSSTTKEEPTGTTDEPSTSSTTKEEPTGTTDEPTTSSTEGSSSTIEGDTSSTTKEEPTGTTDEPPTSLR